MTNKNIKLSSKLLNMSSEEEIRVRAQEFGISGWEIASRNELIEQILECQDNKATKKPKDKNKKPQVKGKKNDENIATGKFSFDEKAADCIEGAEDTSSIELENIENPLTSEDDVEVNSSIEPENIEPILELRESQEAYVNEYSNGRLLLPTSVNEFTHFWERGYLCHPAVLMELVKQSHGSYDACSIFQFECIDLGEVYHVNFELLLEFESEKGEDAIVTANWICPFKLVKRVIVNNIDERNKIIRFLNATSRGISKNLEITVESFDSIYNKNQNSNLTISENANKPSGDIIEQFKKLDSYLGAIAMSSFIERKTFVNRGQSDEGISFFGYLAGDVLKQEIEIVEKKGKEDVFGYIKKRIREDIHLLDIPTSSDNSIQYCHKMFDLLKNRKDELILESALAHNESNSGRFPEKSLVEIKLCAAKRRWRDAIQQIPSNPRDPFLIFSLIKGNFVNLDVPASADRQSFMLTLDKYVSEGLITQDEMVLQGYLLGLYISYPLLWRPIVEEDNFNLIESDLLKLKLSDEAFFDVIFKILPSLPLLKLHKGKLFNAESGIQSNRTSYFWKAKPHLQLVSKNDSLKIVDADYELFEEWSKKPNSEKLKVLMMLLMSDLNLKEKSSIHALLELYFKHDSLDTEINDIKRLLLTDNFSKNKREWLRILLKESL
jgi:hypothetical protein